MGFPIDRLGHARCMISINSVCVCTDGYNHFTFKMKIEFVKVRDITAVERHVSKPADSDAGNPDLYIKHHGQNYIRT